MNLDDDEADQVLWFYLSSWRGGANFFPFGLRRSARQASRHHEVDYIQSKTVIGGVIFYVSSFLLCAQWYSGSEQLQF